MSTEIKFDEGYTISSRSYTGKVFVTLIDIDDVAVNSSTDVRDVLLFQILKELRRLNEWQEP